CKYERFLRELEQLFSQVGIIHHGNSRNDLL
ncbi:MAG: ribonuclease P protein component, partial [Synechocystis sp.]